MASEDVKVPHSSGAATSGIKVSADLVAGEGLLPGSETALFCVLTWLRGQAALGVSSPGPNLLHEAPPHDFIAPEGVPSKRHHTGREVSFDM